MDSQATALKVLPPHYPTLDNADTVYQTILQRQSHPIHEISSPNVFISPSHILLSNTDVELTTAKYHLEARLKDQLLAIRDQCDHILVDAQCFHNRRQCPDCGLAQLLRVGVMTEQYLGI